MSDELVAAANLLRAYGYAVVTDDQVRRWENTVRASFDREHEQHGEMLGLYHDLSLAINRLHDLLGGSRPVWYRDLRRRWNTFGYYRASAVPPEPKRDLS